MKRLLIFLAVLLFPVAAQAQVPVAVIRSACGGLSLTAGKYFPLAIDLTGNLCTNASAGGGGGPATLASGAVAAGAYSVGSFVSGSVLSGAFADGAITTIGTEADAAYAGSGSSTEIAALKGIYAAATAPLAAGSANIGTIGSVGSQYPTGAVAITASPSNGTTGSITATLAHVTGHTVYICGFAARANATVAVDVNLQVTGTITGTLNFLQWIAPVASGIGLTEEIFTPCVPASGINTDIAVVTGAPGTGGADSVSAWGYSL